MCRGLSAGVKRLWPSTLCMPYFRNVIMLAIDFVSHCGGAGPSSTYLAGTAIEPAPPIFKLWFGPCSADLSAGKYLDEG